jgi:hypothetical protein
MRKILYIVLGILAFAGLIYFNHRKHAAEAATAEQRANDDHAVHIAMNGHNYVIPRYFLVSSPGDDVILKDTMVKRGPGSVMQTAEIDLVAALPGFTPVPNAERRPPYGGRPEGKVLMSINNRPFQPQTLADYTATLKTPFTTAPAPAGLTQEDDASLKGRVPAHHYFGAMYGRQLMITCQDAPGLSCAYHFPLKDAGVEVTFARSALADWYRIYPASVQFVTQLQVN